MSSNRSQSGAKGLHPGGGGRNPGRKGRRLVYFALSSLVPYDIACLGISMSFKAVCWILLAAVALAAILLLNYWASFQPLSTLAYAGIVVAVCGLANIAVPFRFLGIRKRFVGILVLIAGGLLALVALNWPASMVHTAQHKTLLDDVMPEYQFYERHSQRIHAPPAQVMQAIRRSTVGDLKSWVTLLRIRAIALGRTYSEGGDPNELVLEALSSSFIPLSADENEIVMGGIGKVRSPKPKIENLAQFAGYQLEGVKIAFNLRIESAGDGWSRVYTETRVLALDDYSRRIMARYWRLIVPGSGLLRREWLEGIKRRAEAARVTS
jgi:hypothetical protein